MRIHNFREGSSLFKLANACTAQREEGDSPFRPEPELTLKTLLGVNRTRLAILPYRIWRQGARRWRADLEFRWYRQLKRPRSAHASIISNEILGAFSHREIKSIEGRLVSVVLQN